jgi:transcriptional regulator with XRE-family HTH domain
VSRADLAAAFGAALRNARIERNLTQEVIAELGGVDRTYPSLLERGLRTPSLDVIVQLADALKMPASSLIADTLERLRGRLCA